MKYYIFNIILGVPLLTIGALLVASREHLVVILRTALALTLLCFPWDYLGIHFSTWDYDDPGLLIFGVPVNDLIFIFYCSFLSTAFLTSHLFKELRGTDADSE